MHPVFERHLEALNADGREVETLEAQSGAVVITVRDVDLPQGWNRTHTDIRFVVPAGYPFAAPDCFWADEGLTLDGGQQPTASNNQPLPETGANGTWFSWHVASWNPNSDNLLTFFRLIRQRLQIIE